eukprot:2869828-Pleurochrysis_carterae.AAC.3
MSDSLSPQTATRCTLASHGRRGRMTKPVKKEDSDFEPSSSDDDFVPEQSKRKPLAKKPGGAGCSRPQMPRQGAGSSGVNPTDVCAPCKSDASFGASAEAPSNHTGNYIVEHAKTGRAKCQVCGELIVHRSLRVGFEVEEKSWGVVTRWQARLGPNPQRGLHRCLKDKYAHWHAQRDTIRVIADSHFTRKTRVKRCM